MKKKQKQLLVLVIVLAALCCFYGALKLWGKNASGEESTTEESQGQVLLDVDADSVQQISYEHEGETVAFSKDGDSWVFEKEKDLPLNQNSVASMAGLFSSLIATETVQDSLTELSGYGLSEPSNTVRITLTDGTIYTLYVGAKNSITGEYYFCLEGDSHVYMTDSDLGALFGKGPYELANVPSLPDMDSTSVTGVELTRGKEAFSVKKYADGRPELDYSGSFLWYLQKGDGTESVADRDQMDALLEAVTGLYYEYCVDWKPSWEALSRYGLQAPALTLSIHYTEEETEEAKDGGEETPEETQEETKTVILSKTMTLEVGGRTEDGESYYVRESGAEGIYTVKSSVLEYFLGVLPADFANRYIGYVSIDQVSRVEIGCEGKSMTMDISSSTKAGEDGKEEDVTVYQINGNQVEASDFKALYTAILSLNGEKALEEGKMPEGEEELTITFYLPDNGYFPTVTLKLTPYDSSYYAASENGIPSVLVNKTRVAALKEKLTPYLR